MNKINPIAEQSKQWLTEALFSLMKENHYSEITITEISEKALLSRRTFYRNFHSKEDVVIYSCIQLCEEYISYLDRNIEHSVGHIIEVYFSFWQKHIEYLTLLTDHHLLCHLIDVSNKYWPQIYDRFKKRWQDNCTEKELEYCLLFNMGGLWNILLKWLYDQDRDSPAEMEKIIQKSLFYFMKSI